MIAKAKARRRKIKKIFENSSDMRGDLMNSWGNWYKRIKGPSPTKIP
jgi:hypothetical protein